MFSPNTFTNFNWKRYKDEGVMKDCICDVIAIRRRWQKIGHDIWDATYGRYTTKTSVTKIARRQNDNNSKKMIFTLLNVQSLVANIDIDWVSEKYRKVLGLDLRFHDCFKMHTLRLHQFCRCMGMPSDESMGDVRYYLGTLIESKLDSRGNLECNLNNENDLNQLVSFFHLLGSAANWNHFGLCVWNVFHVEDFAQLKEIRGLEIYTDTADRNQIAEDVINFQLEIADSKQDCDAIVDIVNCFDAIKQSLAKYNLDKSNNEYHMFRCLGDDLCTLRKQNILTRGIIDHLAQYVLNETPINDESLVKFFCSVQKLAFT